MAGPQRLQLSRKRGYRLPAGAVVVTRPGKWGNPFAGDRPTAVKLFRVLLNQQRAGFPVEPAYPSDAEIRAELAGKDIACWCPLPAPGEPDICHGAELLRIANQTETADAT